MNVTRWGTLIYIMVCLIISTNIQAQENHAPLQKQVLITNTFFSIDSLATLITAQTGVFLSFNSNKVAAGKKIVTRKRSYAVAELLELIKSNTGSDYKLYKDHVIFHGGDKKHALTKGTISSEAKRTTAQTASKNKSRESSLSTVKTNLISSPDKSRLSSAGSIATRETKTKKTTSTRSVASGETKNTSTAEIKLLAAAGSSTISSTPPTETNTKNTNVLLEPLNPKAPQMQEPSISLLLKPAIMAQRPIPSPQRTRWFADGGFTVDDVLYLNTSITAGHKYLHGFFSWSSSFKVSGFRYGLGSMLPLSDEWRIGMMVTTGKLSRDIDFTGVRDTLKNIIVKSELHRLAIQVERSLRPNLVVKAGPVFNLLKSSYYQDGSPVTIATSGYEGTNGDREIYTVRPLYTLSNSYKDTESTNAKTWIGFQVSLCYRFNF